MLEYDFMRMAFAASGCVAVLAGPVGWFLALRGQSFAGHALSHIGFAGAVGAALLGWPPLVGLLAVAVVSGAGMGALGDRATGRDVAIGMILSLAMGCGALFLHLLTHSAMTATALLFGNVLGVTRGTLASLAVITAFSLAMLAFLSRPLLFASLQPELAEARGVRMALLSVLFLMLVGAATAGCAQVTGVLLVFTLMVGPGATILRVGLSPALALPATAALALAEAWGGLALSWWSNAPASFWIAVLSVVCFLVSGIPARSLRFRREGGVGLH